jgi:ubiquinone/menaquinone biosynthesis C-methylase UbiE
MSDGHRKQAELDHGRSIAVRAEAVWRQDSLAGQLRVARRSALLVESAGLGSGVRALELGCGTGQYTAYVAQSGADVYALDLVGELLDLAVTRVSSQSARFVRGDAEQLPFPNGAFDAVVGNAVLHHLRLPQALAEVRRVLRSGGRCAFTEPNMLNPQVALTKNVPPIKRWLGDTPHETAFFLWSIGRAFRSAGFLVERVVPFDFLHPSLPGNAIPFAQALEARLERLPLVSQIAGSLLIVAQRSADQ